MNLLRIYDCFFLNVQSSICAVFYIISVVLHAKAALHRCQPTPGCMSAAQESLFQGHTCQKFPLVLLVIHAHQLVLVLFAQQSVDVNELAASI